MATWDRLGLIHVTAGQRPWMTTHAQMPVVETMGGSLIRIYFTCRDTQNRSHMAWLVTDLERPDQVLALSQEPLLGPGEFETFDDKGVMKPGLVIENGRRHFYTIGLNIKAVVPMHTSVGLASGPADGDPVIDERLIGPVFERNPHNPYYVSTPWVLRDEAGWRMWYMSGLPWTEQDGKPASRYDVRHARSADGVNWIADATQCVPLKHADELAIARPYVLKDGALWRMWYCYRGTAYDYRIGYADSEDGEAWTRRDHDPLRLDPAGSGFDSTMTCYPFVFDHSGERWMVYAGDAYGQGGLGVAKLSGRA